MIPDDRIIFINFVPGSFGSFLLHCLCLCNEVHPENTQTKTLFFSPDGAAHHNINQFLDNFHGAQNLITWLKLDDVTKNEYIIQNWKPPASFGTDSTYYVHRLLLPKYTQIFKKFFPRSKFIKITIAPKHADFIREMFIQKRINTDKVSPLYAFIMSNNDIIEGVYNFDVSHFIEGTFVEEFNNLCEWLNFQKIDVSDFYEKFKKANNL